MRRQSTVRRESLLFSGHGNTSSVKRNSFNHDNISNHHSTTHSNIHRQRHIRKLLNLTNEQIKDKILEKPKHEKKKEDNEKEEEKQEAENFLDSEKEMKQQIKGLNFDRGLTKELKNREKMMSRIKQELELHEANRKQMGHKFLLKNSLFGKKAEDTDEDNTLDVLVESSEEVASNETPSKTTS